MITGLLLDTFISTPFKNIKVNEIYEKEILYKTSINFVITSNAERGNWGRPLKVIQQFIGNNKLVQFFQ